MPGYGRAVQTKGARSPAGRLALVASGSLLVMVACFPHRLEYPAHVLAGLGLAGLGVALTARAEAGAGAASRALARRAVAVVAGVALLAVLAEVSFAGPPEVLDVANTVMGALLGVATVLTPTRPAGAEPGGRAGVAWLAVVGIVLVVAGMAVRYPVQQTVKHWWWFGS